MIEPVGGAPFAAVEAARCGALETAAALAAGALAADAEVAGLGVEEEAGGPAAAPPQAASTTSTASDHAAR
ncbi:MAG TPA: hypothetical protein VKU60_00220 [Chloroflexota bacterium]|nr:hypothetical protein [Chloroflexota bacterium]